MNHNLPVPKKKAGRITQQPWHAIHQLTAALVRTPTGHPHPQSLPAAARIAAFDFGHLEAATKTMAWTTGPFGDVALSERPYYNWGTDTVMPMSCGKNPALVPQCRSGLLCRFS